MSASGLGTHVYAYYADGALAVRWLVFALAVLGLALALVARARSEAGSRWALIGWMIASLAGFLGLVWQAMNAFGRNMPQGWIGALLQSRIT